MPSAASPRRSTGTWRSSAGCLALIARSAALSELLGGWGERFEDALVAALLRRLGVAPAGGEADRRLAAA